MWDLKDYTSNLFKRSVKQTTMDRCAFPKVTENLTTV
jgi:hypothetical protein